MDGIRRPRTAQGSLIMAKVLTSELVSLYNAIHSISEGYEVTIDGRSSHRFYALGPEATYAIARTSRALRPLYEAWQEANSSIFEQHDPVSEQGKDGREVRVIPGDRRAAHEASCRKLLGTEVEANLHLTKLSQLRVGSDAGQNQIPPQLLADLMPMIEDDTR
jgi:hypothetical protein